MIRSDLKSRIRDAINDPSSVIFTDDQLSDLIDEAANFIVAETRSVKRTTYLPIRAGHTFYRIGTIGADVMLPYRIYSHSNNQRLTVTSMEELDQFQQRWIETVAPPEMWFPVAWDLIGIWPSASAAGGTLRVDYFGWPKIILDDNDRSELLEASHDLLVLYSTYIGLLKQWDAQRALSVFKKLQGDASLAKSRSGILRVGHRSYGRAPGTGVDLPSTIRADD